MRRFMLSFVAFVWVLAAVDAAQAGRPRYSDPRELGPYAVGHTVVELNDAARDDRYLRVELWYPADADTAEGDFTFYDFQFLGLGLTSPVAIEDTPVSNTTGFPLIVFSHGSGGVSFQSTPLMEMLASHGFVVVAPNHTGNTTNDALGGTSAPFYVSAENRPRDVSFLIDWMIGRSFDPEDEFYARVNPYSVGVAGHSFGGFTALAMASGFEVASRGIDVDRDPRVKAIAPIAPASSILTDAELESIQIPTLLLSGTLDSTTPVEPETTRPWALIPADSFYRADIVDAEHFHFANICDIAGALFDFGVTEAQVAFLVPGYYETCAPDVLSVDVARRIQNLYVTAFFKKHLWGDGRYDEFLTPAYATSNEPGVAYLRKEASE